MEVLKEILRIVASKGDLPKILPEFDQENSTEVRESLSTAYLKGLLSDRFTDDSDAAAQLYGGLQTDAKYRTLKSRTYEKLLHSLLFLQVRQPEHSEYLSYYYRCTRNLICCQSLMRFASRTAGFEVAERTLTMARKYQFTDICASLCKLLSETAGVWGNKNQFDYYRKQTLEFLEVQAAEYQSDFLLDQFLIEDNVASNTRTQIAALGDVTVVEMGQLTDKYNTHTLKLNLFRMRITLHEFKGEKEEHLSACNEAIQYLESNPHLSQPARLGEFRLRKMIMQMLTQKIDLAFRDSQQVIDSFRVGGTNWYLANYFAAVAALRSEEFSKSREYLIAATSQRQFRLQSEPTKETWMIIQAYLQIAEELGLTAKPDRKSNLGEFRLATYLNSVPEESKKKKVTNIVILISHIYFLILDGNFDGAEIRIEYTRIYISRYLKERHFNRVRIFLRMLLAFPKYSFDPAAIRKANAGLFQQLERTKGEHSPIILYEYIQFETLYQSLISFLERSNSTLAA